MTKTKGFDKETFNGVTLAELIESGKLDRYYHLNDADENDPSFNKFVTEKIKSKNTDTEN